MSLNPRVGDKVKITADSKHKDYVGRFAGTVGEIYSITWTQDGDLYEVATYDGTKAIFISDHFDGYDYNWDNKGQKCTCGAHHTSFKSSHYTWCDLYKKPKDNYEF